MSKPILPFKPPARDRERRTRRRMRATVHEISERAKSSPQVDDARLEERNALRIFVSDLDVPAEHIDELMGLMKRLKAG